MVNGRVAKLPFRYNQKKFKYVGHDSADGYEVGRGLSLVSEALKKKLLINIEYKSKYKKMYLCSKF
jgi:hypothetical protein